MGRTVNRPGIFDSPPRLSGWTGIALALLGLIGLIAPAQLPVVLYKCALAVIGVVLAYWADRALYPYARPHELMDDDWIMSLGCLRRALIVIACVLGLTLGL